MCWSSRCTPLQVLPGTVATSLLLPHCCLPPCPQMRRRLKKLGLGVRKCAASVLLSSSQEAEGRGRRGKRQRVEEAGWRCQQDGQSSLGNVFSHFPCATQRCLWKKRNPLGNWPGNRGWETPSCFSDQGPELRQELKPLEYTHLGFRRRKPFRQNVGGLVVSFYSVKGVASCLALIKVVLEADQLCSVFLSFNCPAM